MSEFEKFREKRKLAAEAQNAQFLRRSFASLLALTSACILFQGFGVFGFHLSEQFLHWLGIVTVGEVAGLFAMVLRRNKST